MKMILNCPRCSFEGLDRKLVLQIIQPRDDNIYKWTCPNGHEVVQVLENLKFELLFDFGALALLDGYTREAVSSFAASIERFHEFCIEVFLTESDVPLETWQKTWKYVAKQSERQLGAFLFLYLKQYGRIPPYSMIDKWTKFRNNVIHQGYIPSEDEVKEYASTAYQYITTVAKELWNENGTSFTKVIQHNHETLRERIGGGPMNSRLIQTVICPSCFPFMKLDDESFEKAMLRLKSNIDDGWVYTR